jgi:hypothetical protein
MTQNPVQTVVDVSAASVVLASLAGWLPPIAAMFGILWYCVLLYDRFLKKKVSGESK